MRLAAILGWLAAAGVALAAGELVCIEERPAAQLSTNLTAVLGCSRDLAKMQAASEQDTLSAVRSVIGVMGPNTTLVVPLPENTTASDGIPLFCAAFTFDPATGAIYRSHPNANQTGDDHAVTAKWTLSGVRLTDEGVFSANGNSVGVTTVGVAHSVSKPVDFEFSDEVQVTLAAEVVVKLMHDDDGSPNASIPAAAGPDYGGQNWTAFALPVATQRLNFAIVDSPEAPIILTSSDTWAAGSILNGFRMGELSSWLDLPRLDAKTEEFGYKSLSGVTMPLTSVLAAGPQIIGTKHIKFVATVEASVDQPIGTPIVVADDDRQPSAEAGRKELVWALRPVDPSENYFKSLAGVGGAPSSQIDQAADAAFLQQLELRGSAVALESTGFAPRLSLQLHVAAPNGLSRPDRGFVLAEVVVRDGQAFAPRDGSGAMPPQEDWLPGREARMLLNVTVLRLPVNGILVSPSFIATESNVDSPFATSAINVFASPTVSWRVTPVSSGTLAQTLPSWLSVGRESGTGSRSIQVAVDAQSLPDGRPAATHVLRIAPTTSTDGGAASEGATLVTIAAHMQAGRAVIGTSALDILVRPGDVATTGLTIANVGRARLEVELSSPESWIRVVDSTGTAPGSSGGTAPAVSQRLAPGEASTFVLKVAPPQDQPQGLSTSVSLQTSDPLLRSAVVPLTVQVAWATVCPSSFALASTPYHPSVGRVDVSNLGPFVVSLAVDPNSFVTIDPESGVPLARAWDLVGFSASAGSDQGSSTGGVQQGSRFVPILLSVPDDRLAPGSSPRGVTVGLTHPRGQLIASSVGTSFAIRFDIVTWRRTAQEEAQSQAATASTGDASAADGGASAMSAAAFAASGGAAAGMVRRAIQSSSTVELGLAQQGATFIERRSITARCQFLPGPVDYRKSVISALPPSADYFGPGGAGAFLVAYQAFVVPPQLSKLEVARVTTEEPVRSLIRTVARNGFGSFVPDWLTPSTVKAATLDEVVGVLVLLARSELQSFEVHSTPPASGAASESTATTPGAAATASPAPSPLPADQDLARRALQPLADGAASAADGSERAGRSPGGASPARQLAEVSAIKLCASAQEQAAFAGTGALGAMQGCTSLPATNYTARLDQVLAMPKPSAAELALARSRLSLHIASAAANIRLRPYPLSAALAGNGHLDALVLTADEFGQAAVVSSGSADGQEAAVKLSIRLVSEGRLANSSSGGEQAGLVSAVRDPFQDSITRVSVQPTLTGTASFVAFLGDEPLQGSGQRVAISVADCPPPFQVPDSTGIGCLCAPGFALNPDAQFGCTLCEEGTEKPLAGNSTTCDRCTGPTFSLGGVTRCRDCIDGAACAEGRVTVLPGTWHEDPRVLLAAVQQSVAEGRAPAVTLPRNTSLLAPSARHKWWLQLSDVVFHECPVASSCPRNDSTTDSALQGCARGHGGPLCAVCEPHYATSSGLAGTPCMACWDDTTSWLAAVGSGVLVLGMLVMVASPTIRSSASVAAGKSSDASAPAAKGSGQGGGKAGGGGQKGRRKGMLPGFAPDSDADEPATPSAASPGSAFRVTAKPKRRAATLFAGGFVVGGQQQQQPIQKPSPPGSATGRAAALELAPIRRPAPDAAGSERTGDKLTGNVGPRSPRRARSVMSPRRAGTATGTATGTGTGTGALGLDESPLSPIGTAGPPQGSPRLRGARSPLRDAARSVMAIRALNKQRDALAPLGAPAIGGVPLKKGKSLFDAVQTAKRASLRARTEAAKERATPVIRSLVNYLQALSVLSALRLAGSTEVRSSFALAETAGGVTLSLFPVQCATQMGFVQRFVASLLLPLAAMAMPFAVAAVVTVLQLLDRALGCSAACKRVCSKSRSTADAAGDAPAGRALSKLGFRSRGGPTVSLQGDQASVDGSARAVKGETSGPGVLLLDDESQQGDKARGDAAKPGVLPPLRLLRRNATKASYSVVALLFVLHFGVLRAIFRAFELYPFKIYGETLLSSDFVTATSGEEYRSLVLPLAIAGGILYGVGIPFVGVLVLLRNAHRLEDEGFRARFGFLYRGLSLKRRGRFLFEAVVLMRKTGLALIAAFGASDAVGQGYMAALWLLLFLVAQLALKPYSDNVVNALEAVSLTSLTITQVANMYYATSLYSWLPLLVLMCNAATVGAFVAVLLTLSSSGIRYAWALMCGHRRRLTRSLFRCCMPAPDEAESGGCCARDGGDPVGSKSGSTEESDEPAPDAAVAPPVARSLRDNQPTRTPPRPALHSAPAFNDRRPSMHVFGNPLLPQKQSRRRPEAPALPSSGLSGLDVQSPGASSFSGSAAALAAALSPRTANAAKAGRRARGARSAALPDEAAPPKLAEVSTRTRIRASK
ncbi:hypothetical protein FNF28_05316 [Cafeteria roenbergensis]|uniref:Tyrosine-protein kinase ephrin type A/B receptor-like domain-containing protein n=1 Tax=Cafeteria roenbergensis TaxID=33653 RepID=A0A5A8D5L2_CAFRO|nr:hypothetical protein FNF28_05316 [Cafeteria roenbergensis]